jgi:DNA-binding response OmpR family regulator
VFSRQALLDQVQGTDAASFDRAIDVHIRNLRIKIEPDSSHPRYIETVFGVGYRLCAEPPEE